MAAKLKHRSFGIVMAGALLSASVVSPPLRAEVALAADSEGLTEIVVTARRRDESIQTTPVAVSALNTAMLESKNAVNIGDLQGAVPNVIITNDAAGAAAANLSIRGLTFADVEKSFDPTVGVVVDGVFLGTNTGQYLNFFDISDFEVLRGPQGTLFGRNTIGGVINITRTKPTGEFGAKVEVSYGSFDTSTERVVLNAPIAKDVLAAKVFYFNTKTDGYYRDALTGRDTGGSQNQNYGAAFLLTPGGGFDALLTVEKQLSYFLPIGGSLSSSSDLFGQVLIGAGLGNQVNRNNTTDLYTIFSNPLTPAPSGHYDAPAATLQMNLDLGPVKLTSVTGYRSSQEDQVQPFDGSSLALYIAHRIQSFHQFSQEIRAAGKVTNSLDYVVGGYFYNGAYILTQYTDLFGSGFGPPQTASGDSKSYAVFADFDWAFADQWRLNFGGRYTKDEKELSNTNTVGGVETLLGAPTASFDKFTPKVSVDYRPNTDLMFYGSYSVGYRSGGFSNRAATALTTDTPFHPETVDSSEIGVKSEWFDKRISVNADYFYAKYKDMQQNTTIPGGPTGNQTLVANVGGSTIKGVELEIVGRASQNLTLNASLGTLSSHFKGFVVNQVLPGQTVPSVTDYSNNNLIFNPSFTGAASADYKIPMSFGDVRANVGYRHIASYDQQISLGPVLQPGGPGTFAVVEGNDPRVRIPHQNLVDASFTSDFVVSHAKAHVTLYGRNLTDTRVANPFTVAGLFAFGYGQEPRSFGVTVGFEY